MSADRRFPRSLSARLAAVLLAVALLPLAWLGFFLVLLGSWVYAQMPDPDNPGGDPCCAYPHTWAEVAGGLGATIVLGAALGVVLFAIFALVRWSVNGRWPSRRRWGIAAAVVAALSAAGFGTSLAVSVAHPPTASAAEFSTA